MTTESAIPTNARLFTMIGIVMFLGLGLAAAVLSWSLGEPRLQLEALPGSVALGAIVALPGLVAAAALRRNEPRLLWPAIVSGLLPALITILSVGLVLVIPVLLLVQAALRWPLPKANRSWRTDLVPLAIPALVVAAGLTFFAHQDPACWEYQENSEGRVTYTRTGTHAGMAGGWFAGGGAVTGLVVDSNNGEGAGSLCVSDRITPLEAAVALCLMGGALVIAGTTRGLRASEAESSTKPS